MDDFTAVLVCLPFIIAPLIVLIRIVAGEMRKGGRPQAASPPIRKEKPVSAYLVRRREGLRRAEGEGNFDGITELTEGGQFLDGINKIYRIRGRLGRGQRSCADKGVPK